MPETTDRLQSLISELVSCETENPPGDEAAAATFILEWFSDRGIDAELVSEPDPDRPQVAVRVGDGNPTVVLNGHIDVVPAGNRDHWSYDPYAAEVVDGRLYGRGSADMKTGVALAMLATVDFAQKFANDELTGSVVFHAAMGEETAEPGTKTLLDIGYSGDYGVVLEPTNMRTATSEKGLAWYEITVEGTPSHASRPDQGSNAIVNTQPVVTALQEYDEEVRQRHDDLVGQAYATITEFDAGTKENVVPESATITIDRRFLPSESADQLDEEIAEILESVEAEHDIVTSWRRTRTYESAEIPVDSHLAEIFRESSANHADTPRDPWGIQASTDVRNLVNDENIEAITWGPADLAQAHTYDEHVDLDEAVTGLEVLEDALTEIFETDSR